MNDRQRIETHPTLGHGFQDPSEQEMRDMETAEHADGEPAPPEAVRGDPGAKLYISRCGYCGETEGNGDPSDKAGQHREVCPSSTEDEMHPHRFGVFEALTPSVPESEPVGWEYLAGNRPTTLCVDTPFGEYQNQVSMNPPRSLELRGPIGIDLCLASEIAGLWARGIRTVSSCCGHGRIRSFIGVSSGDAEAMVGLGYERDKRNLEIFAFTAKGGCAPSSPAVTEQGEPTEKHIQEAQDIANEEGEARGDFE